MRTFTSRILDPQGQRPTALIPTSRRAGLAASAQPVGVTVGGRPPAAAHGHRPPDLRPLCPRSARTPMRSIPHPSQIPPRAVATALTPALGALAVLRVAGPGQLAPAAVVLCAVVAVAAAARRVLTVRRAAAL